MRGGTSKCVGESIAVELSGTGAGPCQSNHLVLGLGLDSDRPIRRLVADVPIDSRHQKKRDRNNKVVAALSSSGPIHRVEPRPNLMVSFDVGGCYRRR